MKDAQVEISEYMEFFKGKRIHQNLGYKTPDHVYFQHHKERKSAEYQTKKPTFSVRKNESTSVLST